MILAEIGDFSRFDNPDQILAYAGLSPTTYQSGQFTSSYAHMEKRGEGKHYYVAISHACKKLVRVIYRMQLTGEPYRAA